jgi:hypothetical protein
LIISTRCRWPTASRVDHRVRVHLQPIALHQLADACGNNVQIEPGLARRAQAEGDVLGDGHVLHQHEVLVDHADAVVDGIGRRMDHNALAVQVDLAGIRLVEAVENLHQRAFAGAILAQQGMDLPGPHLEVHVVVSQHAGKALDDAAHLQRLNAG